MKIRWYLGKIWLLVLKYSSNLASLTPENENFLFKK